MAKTIYTMGEVAAILDENTSAVRYWCNYFGQYVKPTRNAKGNRLFSEKDIEVLKQIKHLLKNEGLTLEGTAARMNENRHSVEKRVKALDSLKRIRASLMEVKKAL